MVMGIAGYLLTARTGLHAQQGAPASIGANDIGGVSFQQQGARGGGVGDRRNDGPAHALHQGSGHRRSGRYLIPDLPKANYTVWARGYGLVDSPKVQTEPGKQVDLKPTVAPDAKAAAHYYPANYWYALLNVPGKDEFPGTGPEGNGLPANIKSQAQYLDRIKTDGCEACHQLGNEYTRTIPAMFKDIDPAQAWLRRLQSGQAGGQMAGEIYATRP